MLLDRALEEEMEEKKLAAVRDYKGWRAEVLRVRDEERRQRNMLKQQQVELVEEWQVSCRVSVSYHNAIISRNE